MRGAPLRIERHDNQKSLGPDAADSASGVEKWALAAAKLVPGEVVAAYLAGKAILQGPPPLDGAWWLGWTILCLVAVFGLRRWMTSDRSAGVPAEWSAVIMSMLSFVIWVFSFGDVFKLYGIWNERESGLALIAWTLLAPLILLGLKRLFRE
ncbi:hypothetical protein GA0061099_1004144 [Bradyrhizobium yuanmingense]|uniref:Uncharacterized protein n=1 Tax=Bradyrhizobium yuanmingense TaxID=108015 RepID=A0A1C3VKV0_9BRAD|nr:hypothetical protein [Bradyrhizobium yuanmingense]TWI28558.1 hypothetical protein IQ15_01903 [Bradyrhizobium yuanmingense]SCB28349.1 hypothetical protein GA0061099_1004144 [Bradyrhizobium yuanmingense]